MVDRLTRITTALAVVTVAGVAAIISYRHAYELVRSHGEAGTTARLVPFTVDGLIWAASMVILDASRRKQPAPALAKWSLAVGIVATVGANVAHGASHGVIGALVSAWPALALVGSFELLMTLTRGASTHTAPPREQAPHHSGTLRTNAHRSGANPRKKRYSPSTPPACWRWLHRTPRIGPSSSTSQRKVGTAAGATRQQLNRSHQQGIVCGTR
ncbi:DUF2637 domain-containing protein [Actinomadura napierensis]|uniref:DUF2637 domain-containing protein n=1 Tax=Actinomadura napierensis TaxID=267854 RepID=A0ABP5KYI6_9ACTN